MHSLYAPVLSWHVLHFLKLNSVNITCLISRNTKTQQVYCTLLLFPKEENNNFPAISLSAHAKTSFFFSPLTVQDHYNAIFFCIYCANAEKKSAPNQKKSTNIVLQYKRADTTLQKSLPEIRWMLRSPWTWGLIKQLPRDTLKKNDAQWVIQKLPTTSQCCRLASTSGSHVAVGTV